MNRWKRQILIGAGAMALGASASIANATTYYVDASVASSGSGTSWTSPKKTIQEVFLISPGGPVADDEVHVSGGTYKPANQTTPIQLKPGIRIKGGYAGLALPSNPDLRDPATYITILDGNLGGGVRAVHVVEAVSNVGMPSSAVPEADRVNLSGVTITGGDGSGAGGGGMHILGGATPRIDRCIITGNTSGASASEEEDGGAGADASSGAGVEVIDSSPVFTNCLFENNQNNAGTVMYGGGLSVLGGQTKVIDCTFSGNRAGHGGAIAIKNGSTVTVVNCLIKSNTINPAAGNTARWGGGISIDRSATGIITNCTIVNNTAISNGGGLAVFSGSNSGIVTNCIIWGNSAGGTGKEIYFPSGGEV